MAGHEHFYPGQYDAPYPAAAFRWTEGRTTDRSAKKMIYAERSGESAVRQRIRAARANEPPGLRSAPGISIVAAATFSRRWPMLRSDLGDEHDVVGIGSQRPPDQVIRQPGPVELVDTQLDGAAEEDDRVATRPAIRFPGSPVTGRHAPAARLRRLPGREGLPSSRRHCLDVPRLIGRRVPDGCVSRLFTASVAFTVISAARLPCSRPAGQDL
jgi:hypothetical protein